MVSMCGFEMSPQTKRAGSSTMPPPLELEPPPWSLRSEIIVVGRAQVMM